MTLTNTDIEAPVLEIWRMPDKSIFQLVEDLPGVEVSIKVLSMDHINFIENFVVIN